jgi:(S)-ureidoglycine aminohydrolase
MMNISKSFFPALMIVSGLTLAQERPLKSMVYTRNAAIAEKSPPVDRMVLAKGSTTDLALLEVAAVTLAPGQKSGKPIAYDDIEELFIIKQGELRFTVGSQSKNVGTGSVAFAAATDAHQVENLGKAPATYYALKFKPKLPTTAARKSNSKGSFIVDWNETSFLLHDRGGRRDIFDRPTNLLDRFEMHVTTLNEGLPSHAPHEHKAEEIILLIEGEAVMLIDGSEQTLPAGGIAFLDSQIFHGITEKGHGVRSYYAFQWDVSK